jgi:hypothetical protein
LFLSLFNRFCQSGNGWIFKEDTKWHFDIEVSSDTREQLGREQGIAS